MKKYAVELTGKSPLILHPDDLEWADRMEEWKNDPANRAKSKAGDDRSPAWRWVGNALHDGEHIAVSSSMLMKCFMEGGAMVPVPGGKNGKTFKSQTQSGMAVLEPFWKVVTRSGFVKIDGVHALMAEESFQAHKQAVASMGFDLLVKRAKIGSSKHVRVRPMFREWVIAGTVAVWDDKLAEERSLFDVLAYAGDLKGIGDWRPSAPKSPGPHGRFGVKIKEIR